MYIGTLMNMHLKSSMQHIFIYPYTVFWYTNGAIHEHVLRMLFVIESVKPLAIFLRLVFVSFLFI